MKPFKKTKKSYYYKCKNCGGTIRIGEDDCSGSFGSDGAEVWHTNPEDCKKDD